jgi:DNA-binding PadR family transcriptional regulator
VETGIADKFLKDLRKRAIKTFMDSFILAEFKNGPMSGYDIIAFIHKKFGVLVSSGTIYSRLYSLERDEMIRGMWAKRKRVYELSEKGEQILENIEWVNGKILSLLRDM